MTSKLKVCIVSPRIYSFFNNQCKVPYGGAEVQLYLLSKEFIKKKIIELSIITGNYDIKKNKRVRANKILFYVSQPLSKKILNFLKRPLNLFLALKQINPDLVIQRAGGIETGICAFYTKLFKKKFIYSIAHEYEVIKKGLSGISGVFYKYGLKNADFIILQSTDQMIQLKFSSNRKFNNFKVIKSGYEVSDIDIETKNYILWVGRAVEWKRPELFLNLACIFPNEQFIIICLKGKDSNYWNKLYSKADKLENVKFLNYVPFQKINDYFKEAKVFVNTSIQEGFPNTFIQALKNKTPILSLNVDPDNFLSNNNVGRPCNDDFDEMVRNLKVLLENREIYEKYSKNSLSYVKKNHNIREISNEWIKLITAIFQ